MVCIAFAYLFQCANQRYIPPMTPAASTTQLCSITRPFSLLHDFTVLDYQTINWSARPFLKSATRVAEAGYVRRVAFVHNSNMFVIGTINALLWMRSVENTYTRTMRISNYLSFTHAYHVQTRASDYKLNHIHPVTIQMVYEKSF